MPWNEPGSGGKDPWGKKNSGGQPDLEQIIDNLRQSFGGKGGGGFNSGGFSPVFLILIAALIFIGSKCFYTVDEGYNSIELRFGKYSQTVGAGLQFILWPIESKILINSATVRTVEIGFRKDTGRQRGSVKQEAEMLTTDENIANVSMAIQYNIPDVKELLFNVASVERAGALDNVVRGAAESALREVVGSTTMDDLFNKGRNVVDVRTKELLQKILDRYQTGIHVVGVEMQAALPPEEVREAFDNVNKADQREQQLIKESKAYEEKVVLEAQGQAARLLAEADAYKQSVVQRATGEAERFNQILSEYQKAPEVTRTRLYIETMEQVLGNANKVMIDQKGGNNMMYLPLDQILKKQNKPSQYTSPSNKLNNVVESIRNNTQRGGR